MEKKLHQMFDLQKFARNPRLETMLAEAEGRCTALDDDMLELVSAAGEDGRKIIEVGTMPVGSMMIVVGGVGEPVKGGSGDD